MVPTVQVKLLAAVAVNAIPGEVPLQILAVAAVVTEGDGFTVTVIVNTDPTQEPVVEVGVTKYCTVPAVELLGLVSVWLIVAPDPALDPVMPPAIVPIVQAKLLGALEVNPIAVEIPLQILEVAALPTAGVGLTVTVIVKAVPTQEPVVAVGVTIY